VLWQRLQYPARQRHLTDGWPSPVRIPTHPVGSSDNIRSVIPGYPVT